MTAARANEKTTLLQLLVMLEQAADQWFKRSATIASILLAVVSVGLTVTYVVLICSLCTYFREQMRQEITRLTFLFATFVLAYEMRFVYQIGLTYGIYSKLVENMIARWAIILFLPLLWDVVSIVSILYLHFASFKNCPSSNEGGTHNGTQQSAVQTIDTGTIDDSILET